MIFSLVRLRISHLLSITYWLYKNKFFVFKYLLALIAVGKTFSFVFNNFLASFVTLAFEILLPQS